MPVVTIYDKTKKKVGDLNLDDRVFNVPFKKHLIYDAVYAYQVNSRKGTASTKTRGEVRGGGKKPFRQKGTGRARQGSSRDSHQVGGGVAFGPRPKVYSYVVPKKVGKAALRSLLSQYCRENMLTVLKDLKMDKIKTKNIFSILKKFSLVKGLIVDQKNENLKKSSSNLGSFKYVNSEGVTVYDLLKFKQLIITEPAILDLEKRLQS